MSEVFSLSQKSREDILRSTGLTVEQIQNTDFDEIDRFLSKRVGHIINKPIKDERLIGRGQVYSVLGRLLSMEDVDKRLEERDRRKSAFIRKNISNI